MKHGLSIAHKAIVSTYKSIQTMELKSFNQIYSPQCIEREEKINYIFSLNRQLGICQIIRLIHIVWIA